MFRIPSSMLDPEPPKRHSSTSRLLPVSKRKAEIHHCFEIPEILLHIFEHVYLSDKGRADLASLALTCKLFSGPALDVLWRIQTSFLPLLMTFPRELLNFAPSDQMAVATFVRVRFIQSDVGELIRNATRQLPKNP